MKNAVKRSVLAVIAVCGFYGVLLLLGGTCPIKWVTGLSCPGCGMTRATLAALRLDFGTAFYYHPLFWLPPTALAAYLGRNHISKRLQNAVLRTACALLIVTYALRLLTQTAPDVVAWTPQEGIAFRLLFHLKQ